MSAHGHRTSWSALEKIPAFRQGFELAVGDAAFEHPEAAVGMDVADASWADEIRCVLNTACDLVCGFDVVHFDVHHAQSDADAWIEIAQCFEVRGWAMSELKHEMVSVK